MTNGTSETFVLVTSLTIFGLCMAGVYGQEKATSIPNDVVVAKALSRFDQTISDAKLKLISDLEKQKIIAKKQNELTSYKSLEEEIETLIIDGTIPTSISRKAYDRVAERAARLLKKTYEKRIKKHSKPADADIANKLTSELEDFKKNGREVDIVFFRPGDTFKGSRTT